MTVKKSNLPSIALALSLVGYMLVVANAPNRTLTDSVLPPDPAVMTLREFITQGPDPVDAEISDALRHWSDTLNGY